MKKHNFTKKILLGMAAGSLLISQSVHSAEKEDSASSDKVQDNGNIGYHLMTEDELKMELNDEGLKTYQLLSPEGKAMARKLASQRCNGTNDCKGLNACRTDKNDCAGKGACKGQSKCSLSDKNLAVKLVSDAMKKKRENASSH